jgi:hypothetical protein
MYKIAHNITIKTNPNYNDFDNSNNRMGGNASLQLNQVASVFIENNVETLTDTAQIKLSLRPEEYELTNSKLTYELNEAESTDISIGDYVEIELYYDNEKQGIKRDRKIQFIGYISKISKGEDKLITLELEDSMWLFKQAKINFSYNAPNNSKNFITGIVGGLTNKLVDKVNPAFLNQATSDNIADFEMGDFRSEGYITFAEALQKVKDDYKLYCFFRNEYNISNQVYDTTPVLYLGFKYPLVERYSNKIRISTDITQDDNFLFPEGRDLRDASQSRRPSTSVFNGFGQPVVDRRKGIGIALNSNISSEIFDKEENLIVVLTSKKAGTDVTSTYATTDGVQVITNTEEVRKLLQEKTYTLEYNIPNIDGLFAANQVKRKWNEFKPNSQTGDITILGMPLVRQGDIVEVTDLGYSFYIDRVVTVMNGNEGFIQKITLGGQL